NHVSQALKFAEQAKGKVLLDLLQSGRARITKAMTATEQQQEGEAQGRLASLNRQVEFAKAASKPDPERVGQLESDLEKARLRSSEFRSNLYAAHPELRTERGQIEPISLSDAANLLPDSRTALLEFLVADQETYLFVLTRNARNLTAPRLEVY